MIYIYVHVNLFLFLQASELQSAAQAPCVFCVFSAVWQEQRAADDLYRKTLRFLVSAWGLCFGRRSYGWSTCTPLTYPPQE